MAPESAGVQLLVQTVVDEVYGGLWAEPPLPLGDGDWTGAWVAVVGGVVVGVAASG